MLFLILFVTFFTISNCDYHIDGDMVIINNVYNKWPMGIIPYQISVDGDTNVVLINNNIKEMNNKLSPFIQLKKRVSERNYVNFRSDSEGCWSYLGMIGGVQTINLGRAGCYNLATFEHEVLHAIGFLHEQSRYDRDKYVKINYENIKQGYEGQFVKSNIPETSLLNYDYNSVMHYGPKTYSKNGNDVMTSINPPGVKIGNNNKGMTTSDIAKIKLMYGDDNKYPTMSPTPSPTINCRKIKKKRNCKKNKKECWWGNKNKRCRFKL